MKKLIYSLVILILFIVIGWIIVNSKIISNARITINDKNLKFENSPFYKEYYHSGNIVVVNIWATWCKPCLEEIPSLNRLKEDYRHSKIEFISYSIDTFNDVGKVKQFVASGKFKWKDVTIENLKYRKSIQNALYHNEVNSGSFQITSLEIPRTLILRNGKLIKEYNGLIDYHDISGFLRLELQKN